MPAKISAMTTEEEIFENAASLSAVERAVFLDKACCSQPELRARVEALLRSHDLSEFMPDRTVAGTGQEGWRETATSPGEQSGDRIGRYRLAEQIGQGGFGVVWM